MTVWCHLLDRIMGPSIREAYLRGFADGKVQNSEARKAVEKLYADHRALHAFIGDPPGDAP